MIQPEGKIISNQIIQLLINKHMLHLHNPACQASGSKLPRSYYHPCIISLISLIVLFSFFNLCVLYIRCRKFSLFYPARLRFILHILYRSNEKLNLGGGDYMLTLEEKNIIIYQAAYDYLKEMTPSGNGETR